MTRIILATVTACLIAAPARATGLDDLRYEMWQQTRQQQWELQDQRIQQEYWRNQQQLEMQRLRDEQSRYLYR